MRIGILGGTFDPVHNGHIYLAKKACVKLRLDKMIFIPSYLPPHKKGVKVTSARHRLNMLKLAIQDNKKFKISDMEIKRRGRSYSVETLRRLRKKYGKKTELFFITGSDSLKELDKWKNLPEILRLCRFVVVERPGFKIKNLPKGFVALKINAKNISSTNIRNRMKKNKPLGRLISGLVEAYIYSRDVYQSVREPVFYKDRFPNKVRAGSAIDW
ncbi:MAG: nicotinate-nucleotide adenylyltransferase [Candidatus Omnitrophota bacterium]